MEARHYCSLMRPSRRDPVINSPASQSESKLIPADQRLESRSDQKQTSELSDSTKHTYKFLLSSLEQTARLASVLFYFVPQNTRLQAVSHLRFQGSGMTTSLSSPEFDDAVTGSSVVDQRSHDGARHSFTWNSPSCCERGMGVVGSVG